MIRRTLQEVFRIAPFRKPVNLIQTRNTKILRRVNPPRIRKKGALYPKKLLEEDFLYELEEVTELKKKENMEVILTTFVDGVGTKGDIVSLQPEAARNKFLLPGLAVYASPENREKYEKFKMSKAALDEPTYSSKFASTTMRLIKSRIYLLFMNKEVPWTVEPWHIKVALRRGGVVAPDYAIELPETKITGPDMSKESKEFVAFVTINQCEKTPVRFRIFHVTKDVPFIKLENDWFLQPTEPLLPEQKDLIASLPQPKLPEKETSDVVQQ